VPALFIINIVFKCLRNAQSRLLERGYIGATRRRRVSAKTSRRRCRRAWSRFWSKVMVKRCGYAVHEQGRF
jgi:hypothetical protein